MIACFIIMKRAKFGTFFALLGHYSDKHITRWSIVISGFFCCFFFDDRYVGVVFFIILLLYDMYSIGVGRHYFVRFLLALVSSLLIAVSGWFVVSADGDHDDFDHMDDRIIYGG